MGRNINFLHRRNTWFDERTSMRTIVIEDHTQRVVTTIRSCLALGIYNKSFFLTTVFQYYYFMKFAIEIPFATMFTPGTKRRKDVKGLF
jgi:hypothetical protein